VSTAIHIPASEAAAMHTAAAKARAKPVAKAVKETDGGCMARSDQIVLRPVNAIGEPRTDHANTCFLQTFHGQLFRMEKYRASQKFRRLSQGRHKV
jgi:hypothetical protein